MLPQTPRPSFPLPNAFPPGALGRRRRNCSGFTMVETLLAFGIGAIATATAVVSIVLCLGAIRTGSDALLLQRDCDEILNLHVAPAVRTMQTIVSAGDHFLVYQLQTNEGFETRAFFFQDGGVHQIRAIPYTTDSPSLMEHLQYAAGGGGDSEEIGRFVDNVLFSFRDGGNNLVSTSDGKVDDVSSIEIVDVRLTLSRNNQTYQVSNSFIPIRQFL